MSFVYREKIRQNYDQLSRSYGKVADFVLRNYYEVAFMTAAQLAEAVGVDTTTVVRFSQRLGYKGYPGLLRDIREQVRSEIYHVYTPQDVPASDPAASFQKHIEQEQGNLRQLLVHNPPAQIDAAMELLVQADRIILVAEGYAGILAEMGAQQLRYRGMPARYVTGDPVEQAAMLASLGATDLIVGISITEYGEGVARVMMYARERGCRTLGIVGSLANPINRSVDRVIYAPTEGPGPLFSVVAPMAALSALVQALDIGDVITTERRQADFRKAYQYLSASDPDKASNGIGLVS